MNKKRQLVDLWFAAVLSAVLFLEGRHPREKGRAGTRPCLEEWVVGGFAALSILTPPGISRQAGQTGAQEQYGTGQRDG